MGIGSLDDKALFNFFCAILSLFRRIKVQLGYYDLLVMLNRLARKIDSRIEPHIFTENSESEFGKIIKLNGEEIFAVN